MVVPEAVNMTIGEASFLLEQTSASLYGADHKVISDHWVPQPGQTCLDIGFGPGTWTLAALARGARVFSFDPRIEAVELLTRQVLLNNFVGCCILSFALQDRSGKALFSDSSFHWGQRDHTVGICSLDQFLAGITLSSLDFVNMDAEGSELEILKGATATLKRYRPKP
jgi:FkbM family methyltransferase